MALEHESQEVVDKWIAAIWDVISGKQKKKSIGCRYNLTDLKIRVANERLYHGNIM